MRNVLLLKAGDAAHSVKLSVGDYEHWFVESLGPGGCQFDILHVHRGARLPDRAAGYDAVMMTGSPASVTQLEPWMERAADFMVGAAARGIPVLGVCFGHQLLAHVHGARVVRNTRGREIGTVEVALSEAGRADPLFHGLPERFTVQATHEDIVEQTPAHATVLAGNASTAVQALAFGPLLRGVQFHPELHPAAMRALILARAEKLEVEAIARGHTPGERVQRLLAGIAPSPGGQRILRNFVERFT
ncbi:glutamine amidotransferase [Vitiosangium sp. GDMCC 1.1324]|uniref:glutamine amidotransferase n=1 Tax=Vitiosangium sp. (strain GDMCC 1.1324) TaxID=2138576 RepID=UPI000D35554F|nr:glutamine amidotransferase [Vitiosangium sp. GDMCC 1.1324]PTL78386.1 glutamine amidotransferase [Vitiosangium sp. GDMCC 1.1324]